MYETTNATPAKHNNSFITVKTIREMPRATWSAIYFFCRQRKPAFAIIFNNTMLDVIMIIHNGKACSYGQIYKLTVSPATALDPVPPTHPPLLLQGRFTSPIYQIWSIWATAFYVLHICGQHKTKFFSSVTRLIAEHVRATMDNIQTKSVEKNKEKTMDVVPCITRRIHEKCHCSYSYEAETSFLSIFFSTFRINNYLAI